MKKTIHLALFVVMIIAGNVHSQIPSSIVGLWSADGFDSYNHKVASGITIQFTPGDVIFFGTNNQAYANGIYQYSGNVLSGSFNVTSNGITKYSFQGSYDVAKQKLVFTSGSGNNVTGQMHYEAVKKTAPTAPQPQVVVKTDADYFLSSVTVVIKTGRDNKEYPSTININVGANYGNIPNFTYGLSSYKNELKTNASVALNLIKKNYSAAIIVKNSLADYKAYGLVFRLNYAPNIFTDAWKIENISLLLEFKDAAGNPHPTMGKKTINFSDSDIWADGFGKRETEYKTDKNFNPLKVRQYDPLKP